MPNLSWAGDNEASIYKAMIPSLASDEAKKDSNDDLAGGYGEDKASCDSEKPATSEYPIVSLLEKIAANLEAAGRF